MRSRLSAIVAAIGVAVFVIGASPASAAFVIGQVPTESDSYTKDLMVFGESSFGSVVESTSGTDSPRVELIELTRVPCGSLETAGMTAPADSRPSSNGVDLANHPIEVPQDQPSHGWLDNPGIDRLPLPVSAGVFRPPRVGDVGGPQ